MSGHETYCRLHACQRGAVMQLHDKDREIGALPGCGAVSAWAKHPRGSALPNGRTCCHMFPSNALELRILQLYIWALNSSRVIDGCRTAPVARYGAYEV